MIAATHTPRAAMMRFLLLLLSCLSSFVPRALAQDPDRNRFLSEFSQALANDDERGIDKTVKLNIRFALKHVQDLKINQVLGGNSEGQAAIDAIRASVARSFEQGDVVDKIVRWCEMQDKASYDSYVKLTRALEQCYGLRDEAFKDNTNRATTDRAADGTIKVAQALEQAGHLIDAAESWLLAAEILNKAPARTVADRRAALQYTERGLEDRKSWYWTKDPTFVQNEQFVKFERGAIEAAAKEEQAREAAGYDPNARGVDALLMPNAKDDVHELEFEMLKDWEQLDYSEKGGPVPAFWWQANFDNKDHVEKAPLAWFTRTSLFLCRDGQSGTKYRVSPDPNDAKLSVEVDAGIKAKPTQFHLDADKQQPYAMFFWLGGDKERVGEADVNLTPVPENVPIFYRSAASWHTHVGQERITLFDDNCNGVPMDTDTSKAGLKLFTLGDKDGVTVSLLDSMQVGKGPRVPFSEFVHLAGGWFHLRRAGAAEPGAIKAPFEPKISLRPFNPEYLKTGKVKLTWSGPKPTAPVQLVIRGKGDCQAAFFDIAGGKEVEVPCSDYQVVYGRILQGKGQRLQTATIWPGSSKPFTVAAGKTTEVKMGAPFGLHFVRGGSDPELEIDGTSIVLQESSGCLLAEPQNIVPVPEVLAAKAADGKGAKVVGRFVKLDDAEIFRQAAEKHSNLRLFVGCFPVPEDNRDGSLLLKCKLPAPGMKVALSIKKHPLLGKVESAFQ